MIVWNLRILILINQRDWWRQKVPKIFSPVPSMNYQKPTEHIEEEDVKRSYLISRAADKR